jgi:hypothetical protein
VVTIKPRFARLIGEACAQGSLRKRRSRLGPYSRSVKHSRHASETFGRARTHRVTADEFRPPPSSQLISRWKEAMDVPNTVEITMTMRGFEVTMGERVTRFPSIEDALDFAQQRLRHAQEVRELSWRFE